MSKYTPNLNGNYHSVSLGPPNRVDDSLANKESHMIFHLPNSSTSNFDYHALVQKLDEKGVSAAWGMIRLHKAKREFTHSDLAQEAGLTYTESRNRLKLFRESNAVQVSRRQNELYPNMQPAKVYSFTSWVDIGQLEVTLSARIISPAKKNEAEKQKQHSEAAKQSQSNEVPKTLDALEARLSAISPPYRDAHIKILQWIVESNSTTASKISRKTGQRPSTSHAQLERLRSNGLICRDKQAGEYHYFLVPGLDSSLVAGLFQKDSDQDLLAIAEDSEANNQNVKFGNEPKAIQLVADMPFSENSSNLQPSKQIVKSMTPAEQFMEIMEKFPAFNPNWSEPLQERWLNSFERMTKFIAGETESNKTE